MPVKDLQTVHIKHCGVVIFMVMSLNCFMVIPLVRTSGNVIVYEFQKRLLLRPPAKCAYVISVRMVVLISQVAFCVGQ